MTIKLRFALLLGMLLGALVLTWLLVEKMQEGARNETARNERQGRATLINHWIDAAGRELPNLAADFAQSDEFVALVANASAAAAQEKISATVAKFNIESLWIVRADSSTASLAFTAKGIEARPLPLEAKEWSTLVAETPNPRFFAESNGELMEICVRRLQAAGSRDWLVLARRWNEGHLQALAGLTESTVTLGGPHESAHLAEPLSQLILIRPLLDWRGRTLRVLRIDCDLSDLNGGKQADGHQARLFILFGLLVLAATGLALQSWVLRPVRMIGMSLKNDDKSAVTPLCGEPSEFGAVAQLVLSSFEQKQALRTEIESRKRTQEALSRSAAALRDNLEERARLGRDLHDGVIQSLYAAGMGLAGIRAQLRPDQSDAVARLEQTRAALNDTIHDVRNFIGGLEPEALRTQTFSQAVADLLDAMQNMRTFRATLALSDELAAGLSLSQRVHALQIIREAVSNALRHGDATDIEVSLTRQNVFVHLEVVDNGSGFNTETAEHSGRGLANFTQRARELGAQLNVTSQLGHGTRVSLTFSPP